MKEYQDYWFHIKSSFRGQLIGLPVALLVGGLTAITWSGGRMNTEVDMKLTLILSLILMAALLLMLYAAVALVQSKKLFGSAPKDIQEAITEHKERFPRARRLGWKLLILAVFVFLGAFIYGAWDGVQNNYSLWMFFGRFLTMLYLLKAFDIIFLDWFLLTRSHFYQHYYPETEGCAGYRQFGFNHKQQIGKIVLFPFIALLLAWICTILR